MVMTDPVADLLTRLRNANQAQHESVSLPSSKLKTHIAEILEREGYIAGWKVADARVGKTLTLDLKYGPNRERSIVGINTDAPIRTHPHRDAGALRNGKREHKSVVVVSVFTDEVHSPGGRPLSR